MAKKEPCCCVKYRATYSLCNNIEGCCLYHQCGGKMKVVPTYENVFDIILEAHSKGGHAKGKLSFVEETVFFTVKNQFSYY